MTPSRRTPPRTVRHGSPRSDVTAVRHIAAWRTLARPFTAPADGQALRGSQTCHAVRPQVELYVRYMQEVRRLKSSTMPRRMSVVTGFYRTCVIDGVLAHSPAEYVRQPNVSPEIPTMGLTTCNLRRC
jgi:site-specific recombinase XerC